MEWMLLPYRRYAEFSGRSSRKEYWMFVLFTLLVTVALAILAGLGAGLAGGSGFSPLSVIAFSALAIFWLATLIPSLAVQVRRFHDQDKSGWFVLLGFIPYIGGFIVIVFMCIEGTRGPNRHGPDPLDPSRVDVFA